MKKNYKWLVLLNVMIGTFMAVMDTTVVNTGLETIMADLGTTIDTIEWVLTGYLLAMATMLPAAPFLSRRFGDRTMFTLSLAVFTIGSLMGGLSSTVGELILWRVIEGFGAGLIMPIGMSIVTKAFPPEERGLAMGFWAVASAASISFGPMLGGYLVDAVSWNSIFFVNVPVGIFGVIFTLLVQKKSEIDRHLRFDIWGFITASLFLPIFLFGLARVNSNTNTQGWNDPVVLACIGVSVIAFIAFVIVETSVKEPLIQLSLFRDTNFAMTNIVLFFFGVAIFGSLFLLPLYMQRSLGYSAFQSGLLFVPLGFIQAVLSPTFGKLTQYVHAKYVIIFGMFLTFLSFVMNQNLSMQTTEWYLSLSLYMRGAGFGILYPPLLALAFSGIPNEQMAQASSITNITRQIGGSFGVALFSFVLGTRTGFHVEHYAEALNPSSVAYQHYIDGMTEHILSSSGAGLAEAGELSDFMLTESIYNQGFISGINDVFYIGGVFMLFSIFLAILIRKKPIPKAD